MATLREEIERDYEDIDDVQTVTIMLQPSGLVKSDVKALRRTIDRKSATAFSGAEIQTDDGVFHVWSVTLDNHATELNRDGNDELTDENGTTWTIIACVWETLRTRWRCLCRRKRV